MPVYQITPLAPACLLLLGAALTLAVGSAARAASRGSKRAEVGPALAPRRRPGLMAGVSALAVLSLFFVGSRHPPDVQLVRVLVEWLDEPALALRVPPFEPFLWVLMLSLLAISLAGWDPGKRTSLSPPSDHGAQIADRGNNQSEIANPKSATPLSQAMLLALTAIASGVVLAGSYRSLAFALLLFDGVAALFLLAHRQPSYADIGEPTAPAGNTGSRAVGRLLLGVLSSATIVALAQGMDHPTASPLELGGLFSLTIWLRLGLYPLLESEALESSLPLPRLGWAVVNLAVGLYLVSTGVAPWVMWPAGVTTVLHGVLGWLGPGRERGLSHVGYALAGGILVMVAVVGNSPTVVAASTSTLAALVALGLSSPQLGRPDRPAAPWDWSHLGQLWGYLPPLLATVSLLGVPFTLGWEGRGDLYRAIWEADALGAVALVVVAEGAALSVLYRYWRRLLRSAPADQTDIWHLLGATLATVPFLIPVVGPRLLSSFASPAPVGLTFNPPPAGAVLGLVGSLLWALFLGYGRRRLLDVMPLSPSALMGALRLGWLLRGLGRTLDTMGRALLRIRAVIEGEHYLAWAILLAMGVGLLYLYLPSLSLR